MADRQKRHSCSVTEIVIMDHPFFIPVSFMDFGQSMIYPLYVVFSRWVKLQHIVLYPKSSQLDQHINFHF